MGEERAGKACEQVKMVTIPMRSNNLRSQDGCPEALQAHRLCSLDRLDSQGQRRQTGK